MRHLVPRSLSLLLLLLLPPLQAQQPAPPGDGPVHALGGVAYRWVHDWGRGDGKTELGNTHGCLVVDRAGEILANTDTEHAIVFFSPEGKLLRSWGKDYHGGLHGMTLRVEDDKEWLYLAHTRRHEVLKVSLDGKVEWTLGWPEASGIYEREEQFNPTAVAVAPDGRIFVADGYGKSWLHAYDRERKYVKSFGGPGSEPGKLRTPHGLWLDTRGRQPLLLVCDRENHRLQWFDLDGNFVRLMDQDLRRPCNVWPYDGGLLVADLAGRITRLDAKDRLLGHLGDNPKPELRAQNGVPREQWRDGEFLSPHSVCADAFGNVYVMDWNFLGRISKLERLPVATREGPPAK